MAEIFNFSNFWGKKKKRRKRIIKIFDLETLKGNEKSARSGKGTEIYMEGGTKGRTGIEKIINWRNELQTQGYEQTN